MKRFENYWFNIRVPVDGGNYLCGGCHYENPEDAAADAWKALAVIIANKDYEEESLTKFIENELSEGKEV